MLRRTASLIRASRTATTVAHSSSSTKGEHGRPPRMMRERKEEEEGKRGVERGGERGGQRRMGERSNPLTEEHVALLRKHGKEIGGAEVKSLGDAVEKIQWHNTVSSPVMLKVATLLSGASKEELESLGDRSLSIVLSSFGEKSPEMQRNEKREIMGRVEKEMEGKGLSLGPLSRVALFRAKVDCSEEKEQLPSIVDELTAWEHASLPLSEEMVVEAARVYGMGGDSKGVIELTNYARESFGRVDSRFVDWLAYSMVASGEGKSGVNAVQKLAARGSAEMATRLWLTAARAAARKGEVETVLACLSRVSLSSNLNYSVNNEPVVGILAELIERGVEGAERELAPYLALLPDGSSLQERHSGNAVMVAKAKRAIKEGKLEAGTRLYALVHENFKNTYLEERMRRSVSYMGGKEEKREEMRRCVERMHAAGIVDDINGFLLKSYSGNNLVKLVEELRASDALPSAVEKSGVNKFALATQIIKNAKVAPSTATVAAAAILFSSKIESMKERDDVERIVFKNAARNDPAIVSQVLDALAESGATDAERLAYTIVSAALGRILVEPDVLASGRVESVLASPNLAGVRLFNLEGKLIRVLRTSKDEEQVGKAVEIVGGVIGAAFKGNSGRKDNERLSLVRIIGNTDVSQEKVERLVEKMRMMPSISLDDAALGKAREELKKRGLEGRAGLMEKLKRKGQASARWLASTPDDLERELISLENGGKAKEGVLITIRSMLMEKLVVNQTFPMDRLSSLLVRVIPTLKEGQKKKEEGENDSYMRSSIARLREATEKVYMKAMRAAVLEGDWKGAAIMWNGRTGLKSLPLAPTLALAHHEWREGRKEEMEEIVEGVRRSGQSVSVAELVELGDLFSSLSDTELTEACEWVKRELRVEGEKVEKMKQSRTKRKIAEKLTSGDLPAAFALMKEASEGAKNAIGHFDVMRVAIRSEQHPILEQTVNVVASLHSKATAILDLAFSFLLERKIEYGEKLFRNPSLKLSHSKLRFYMTLAAEEKRMDALHSLFSIMVTCPTSDERISNGDLNLLAYTVLRAYVTGGDSDKISSMIAEIRGSTLVVERALNEMIMREKTKLSSRSSAV